VRGLDFKDLLKFVDALVDHVDVQLVGGFGELGLAIGRVL
jgi:hypothetical protein